MSERKVSPHRDGCLGASGRQLRPVILINTPQGIEVRCAAHQHLLGVFVAPGRLVIKCSRDEFALVEWPMNP